MLNVSRFLQLFLDSNSREKAQMPFIMSIPTAFEAQFYFSASMLICREVGAKKLDILGDAMNTTLAGMAVHLIQNVWNAQTKSCQLGPLGFLIESYMTFKPAVIQFQLFSQRTDGFVSVRQKESLFKSLLPMAGPDGSDVTGRKCSLEIGEEFFYLILSAEEVA